MTDLRLVVFDVDGTLVDSQADILGAMNYAFSGLGLAVPDREAILGIVGLSLDVAMTTLLPDGTADLHTRLVEGYKAAYFQLRAEGGVEKSSPFYPGAREMLEQLHAVPHILLGVATGKSQRGLDKLLEGHGLTSMFVTRQAADFHPSKPHPSMLQAACAETGVDPRRAVMVGDTSFDMDMAAAAGMSGIGVTWGYHGASRLGRASILINAFADLPGALDFVWGTTDA